MSDELKACPFCPNDNESAEEAEAEQNPLAVDCLQDEADQIDTPDFELDSYSECGW